MLKNNTHKFNKFLFSTMVLCLLVLFSACLMLGNHSNALADAQAVDVTRSYVANDYIFEDEDEHLDYAINGDTYEPLAGDVDASGMSYYSLRDDYVIYTQDQARNGLCWAFASSMALGTTFMLATGEFYDFSEAWIGLGRLKQTSSYIFGDGGNASYFNSVASAYGLVLESDLTYDYSYLINREDYTSYFEYYSQFANKELYEDVDTVYFSTSNKEQVKNHIYNNGALSISMYWNTSKGSSGIMRDNRGYSYKYPSAKTSTTGGHAITAIGWDDTVSTTIDGTTYTGAWICLNSWGEDVVGDDDGILYVFYNDTDLYGSLYGYKYNPKKTADLYFNNNIKAGTGYTSYTTNLKGKYYSGYTASSNITRQQNIYFDNNVDITYEYDISSSSKINSINVFYGEEDVTTEFDITLDKENKEYTLKANNLRYGPYKILVEYSNSSAVEEYVNMLYINSDAVISNLYTYYSSSSSGISNNGNFLVYSSYNYEGITVNLATTQNSGSCSLYFTPTSYSNINSSSYINISFSGLGADNQIFSTTKKITSASGATIDIIINILFVQDSANYKMVNVYYGLNGGVNPAENLSREIFSTTSGLTLAEPTRKGFEFVGWYYDSALTKPVTSNNYIFANVTQIGSTPTCYAQDYYKSYFNNSNIAFVYAKWSLKEPTGATLKASATTLAFAQNYTISVASITHDLGKLMTIESVDWYLGGTKIQTTSTDYIEQTAGSYGSFTYYAVIKLKYLEQTIYATSSELTVIVLDSVSEIDYTNGTFSWDAIESATAYNVILFKVSSDGSASIKVANETQTELSYTLLDKVSSEGRYYIVISAVIIVGDNHYNSAEKTSNPVDIYEVKYNTFDQQMDSLFVDKDTKVNNLAPLNRSGYTFEYWCTDQELENAFEEGTTITESIQLYALWTMQDMLITTSIPSLSRQYSGEPTDIVVEPSHESGLVDFVYKWEYKPTQAGEYTLIEDNTTNTIRVLNVADSGYYICTVTLTDDDGFSVTNSSAEIPVKITKQITTINTDMVVKDFTYTGLPQAVDAGALLLDGAGEIVNGVEFEYTVYDDAQELGTTFVNVPLSGQYKLKISSNGNENYAGAIAYVYLTVHKAVSEIIINKAWQTYRYTGKPVEPTYTIANSEQVIDSQDFPINKGEYDVTLVAPETQNYERITTQLHITIAPANIRIIVNDVTSILFFAAKEPTCTIEGEVFEGDNLNPQAHVDVDTSKLGSYEITVTYDNENENYYVALEVGTYTVTGWPYYIGIGIILIVAYFVIKMIAKRRYQYDFETNGGSVVSPIDTKAKNELLLETPTRDGYNFIGWYTDIELTKPFTEKFVKSKGKTLYAKWQKQIDVTPVSQEEVSAQQIVDEIYTKLNPDKQITDEPEIDAQVEEIIAKEPSEEEKMQELINSLSTKNSQKVSNAEMDEFIKQILNNN